MALAKVFASKLSRVRVPNTNGALRIVFEYTMLSGAARSGKTSVDVGNISNERSLDTDAKELLAAYLSTLYSETIKERDIVLG